MNADTSCIIIESRAKLKIECDVREIGSAIEFL